MQIQLNHDLKTLPDLLNKVKQASE
ncbi:MAG: hypothetical protein RL275_3084, partial [Chloroflexota bacterium]